MIDDVWSGGSRKDGNYPLISDAIAAGLYHPRCRDSHTTYFPGITTVDSKYNQQELAEVEEQAKEDAREQYAQRQANKYGRLAEHSLNPENKEKYARKREEWRTFAKNNVENITGDGIMELTRKTDDSRKGFKFISDKTFNDLTIESRKNGAIIVRGTVEVESHLDKLGAAASNIGDILCFRKDVCISEVLEETYHFKQNRMRMNDDKPDRLRSILNEIDAKKYLLNNASKYKIPRNEVELTRKQLKSYRKQLEQYRREVE